MKNYRLTKMMLVIFAVVLFMTMSGSVLASVDIRGVVEDQDTGKPIAGVKIKYKHAVEGAFRHGTITDEDGRFKMVHTMGTGIMELLLEAEGYDFKKEELFLDAIDIKKVRIKLKKAKITVEHSVFLEYKDAHKIGKLLQQRMAESIKHRPVGDSELRITGDMESVQRAEELIREFDRPARKIMLQVKLITANGGQRKKVEYDPKVKNILKQLTSLFKYNYYWVVGQAEMTGLENEPLRIMNESQMSAFTVKTHLKVQKDIIKLERLQINVAKPGRAEIMTTVNIRDGETVILGASGGQHEGEALITALTAKFVE